MRICVIGAGAAGICAARRVQEDAIKNGILDIEIRVFEQSNHLGGTWVFDEAIGAHSSMYSNLRTNIPQELIVFDEFPFLSSNPGESSYPRSEKILEYLTKFAHPIQHLIQFNTRVLCVRKSGIEKWEVEFEQKCTKIIQSELFDAIFVCNGHFSVPRLPNFVDKLDKNKLEWIHSHQYRRAEHFAGKNVAVVGARSSGRDILLQLAKHAKKVYFLHMSAPKSKVINGTHKKVEGLPAAPFFFHFNERPKNCEEGYRVVDANESDLILADGNELGTANGLDAVIFCTGYRYSIPFLEAEGLIKCPEDGSFVSPIWAKCIHVHHPRSIFIIGLPFSVLPFPLFDSQIRLALALFHGRIQPPPIEEMLAEEANRLSTMKKESIALKYFHIFPYFSDPNSTWDYCDWLDEISGYGKRQRPPAIYGINEHFVKGMLRTCNYRNIRYEIKNEGKKFEVIRIDQAEKWINY